MEAAGYGASVKGEAPAAAEAAAAPLTDKETPRLLRRLIASLVVLLALMYVSMGHMMLGLPLPPFFDGNHVAMGLLQLLLAAVVMIINQKFFVSGFRGLLHRAPNMDTLVALGSGASFLYSVYALFAMTRAQVTGGAAAAAVYMDSFYFESAAMILTLITVGKTLEARAKGKTTDALKSLMQLAPRTATVERGGRELQVPIEQVRVGDTVLVRPGDSIPVDAEVLDGGGAVDESALTGESLPVDKEAGDLLSAGTVNRSGFFRCRKDTLKVNVSFTDDSHLPAIRIILQMDTRYSVRKSLHPVRRVPAACLYPEGIENKSQLLWRNCLRNLLQDNLLPAPDKLAVMIMEHKILSVFCDCLCNRCILF